MQTWGDERRNKREVSVKGRCHRITCTGYKRKEYIRRGKERFKEQYSANIDVSIRELDML